MPALASAIIGAVHRRLHSPVIRRGLRLIGVSPLLHRLYARQLIARGEHEARLFGRSLRFVISSEREIQRIDNLMNERAFVARILGAIQPGDVAYDVGANIGVISMLMAGCEGVRAVHSFEPEPRNADHLGRSAQLNGFSHVAVHEIALGDADGTISLHVFSESSVGADAEQGGGDGANADESATDDSDIGEGRHSIIAVEPGHEGAAIDVELRRMDAFARQHEAEPDVVKIDVEGAEYAVVEGMRDLLEACRVRDIFVELHPRLLAEAERTVDDVEALITSRGYELAWSSDRDFEVHRHFRRRDADASV